MTQTTTPPEVFDRAALRTSRGGDATRVFVGGDLLGSIRRTRIPTGRGTQKAWRWIAKPAGYAWTQGRTFEDGAPPVLTTWTEPLPPATSLNAAVDALVHHLRIHDAVAVEPLFGGPRW